MAENFDFSSVILDDNSFVTVPEGDYHFTVTDFEVGFSTSEKMPANTQVIKVNLSVPFTDDGGDLKSANVKLNLNVYSKALFAIRQFFESIGLLPEQGRAKMPDLNLMLGRSGVCELTVGVSSKGNEYNSVSMCYPPSKAPNVCANDDAWAAKDKAGFKDESSEEVNPFVI